MKTPPPKEVTDILEAYSRWLEKHGYMDSDWYTEGNTVDEFIKDSVDLIIGNK